MSKRRRQREEEAAASRAAQPTPSYDVRIAVDSTCTVGGTPIALDPGLPLHESVLNYLHRHALATAQHVDAVIHDNRSGFITPIRVLPDGSSELAGQPVVFTVPSAPAAPMPPAASSSSATAAPSPTTSPSPAPPDPKTLITPRPTLRPPVREQPAPRPQPTPVEIDGPELLARLTETIQANRLTEAAALTRSHIPAVVRTHGAEHSVTLQLRELEAYLDHLNGENIRAADVTLDIAAIWFRNGDERAYQCVVNAAAAWNEIRNDTEGLRIGRTLLPLWTDIAATRDPATVDESLLDYARKRLNRIIRRVAAEADGAVRPEAS